MGAFSIDWRPVLFTAGVGLRMPVLFSFSPLFESSRADLSHSLCVGGRRGTEGTNQRRWMSATIAVQYALVVILLLTSGLLLRSFIRLRQVDPGFKTEHVLSLAVKLPQAGYPQPAQVNAFYDNLLRDVKNLPGVFNAG